jgi:hypothetical protein
MSRTLACLITATACVASSPALLAQDSSPEELVAKLEEKLAKPFVAEGPWMLDYEAALAQASAEDKLLFVYYTRSYAP